MSRNRTLHRSEPLIEEWPLESWKAYLRWNVIDAAALALPSAFVNADYEFRGACSPGSRR